MRGGGGGVLRKEGQVKLVVIMRVVRGDHAGGQGSCGWSGVIMRVVRGDHAGGQG